METVITVTKSARKDIYDEILPQLASLLSGERNFVANLANTCSVLKHAFPQRFSWVGFYLQHDDELVLGPFQGKPACVRIRPGKGVCGTAAAERRTVVVPDVRLFPGHIACDPDSKSEIVLPMLRNQSVIGVLDVDSTQLNAFDGVDERYLAEVILLVLAESEVE